MKIFTVATVSYLKHVDILFASLKRVHPEYRLALILADCSRKLLPEIRRCFDGDIELLICEDLLFDNLDVMRRQYNVLEFCSALKVLGVRHFLKTVDCCLFIDPDIVIFNRFDESIFQCKKDIVISVHSFEPYPDDSNLPNDLEPCLAGHVNGGILFVRKSPKAQNAMAWLSSKTRFQWFVAPSLGMYADQQWLSALPFFFSTITGVINDKGVNVAYWNLHERKLTISESGEIVVDKTTTLKLFHFSGFPNNQKNQLSIHSSRVFEKQTQIILNRIINDYMKELLLAEIKFKDIRGDVNFSQSNLKTRLRIAEQYWGQVVSPKKSNRIINVLRKIKVFFKK
jgi:hypothetical protein